ncbi:MAG TPA: bifunctional riboflavin kinase/FAD synthetase [Caulobacterales bacterium]|nr:bifunctional riboflavin kinase/FAD synthetase [Caulobacterales bacterium]
MRRFLPDDEIPGDAKGAAIALGNFDGVHKGHQGVIAAVGAYAHARGLKLGAAAFEPHPRRVFQPEGPPFRLQTPDQRARALADQGVELLFKIRFDRALSQSTDFEFCERVLKDRLGAAHVVVGFDFRFGRGRMGDVESLRRHGEALGFTVMAVQPIEGGPAGAKVSSTAIRAAIARGDMSEAARMLGRPWAIEGEVRRGLSRGREMGIPTANMDLDDYVRPRLGIYAVRADLGDGVKRPGVASIGVHPTVGALPEPVLETHLFDFDGYLYGAKIEIEPIAFLRDEVKFDTVEAMLAQIARDVEQARAVLDRA